MLRSIAARPRLATREVPAERTSNTSSKAETCLPRSSRHSRVCIFLRQLTETVPYSRVCLAVLGSCLSGRKWGRSDYVWTNSSMAWLVVGGVWQTEFLTVAQRLSLLPPTPPGNIKLTERRVTHTPYYALVERMLLSKASISTIMKGGARVLYEYPEPRGLCTTNSRIRLPFSVPSDSYPTWLRVRKI